MAKGKCGGCGGNGMRLGMDPNHQRHQCAECGGSGFVDREADYWNARASVNDLSVKFPTPSPFIRGYPSVAFGQTRTFIERMRHALHVMELNADAVEK